MATIDQFISSLVADYGDDGKGKKFEIFCKWFLENDPGWSKTVDKVWLWKEYPEKWQRQDLGTDLIFRDKNGDIWAVQAKCFSEHRPTKKEDMNSFLADSGRKKVSKRLWMQTTNKIEGKALKTLLGQDKPVTIFNLDDFRNAEIDYPRSFSELYQAKVRNRPSPDDHQIQAVEDVVAGFKVSDRGQMIMACGTGKTFTTLWINEALKAKQTLVLLPSLNLLSQTLQEWAWAGHKDFEILNVCSDKSVSNKIEDVNTADAPFPVTSEISEIKKFLKKSAPRVIFCTYQSSNLIAEAQLAAGSPPFDLAISDEAHRCAGRIDAGFATILDNDKIKVNKRLFTTATPRYLGRSIKDAANANDLVVIGMDDESVFGPVFHQLSFGKAIRQDLLNDYQVVIVGVDEPMVKQLIEENTIVSINPDENTDASLLAAKIGTLKAIKDYDLKRVISFHSRVSGAKKFSEEIVDVVKLIEPSKRPDGTFYSDYVSGEMIAGERKEKINKLKALDDYDRGILSNARCLAEGVDVPSLDGVAFIDPKGSQVEIIQAVGRAIRTVRGAKVQTKGTIVIPVFIEDGDDHEASIEASNFKPVWDVLKALRAHDEVLADDLDQYRTNMAKKASQRRKRISDKIVFDLPMSVTAEFSSALRTVLVEASTASWEFWFGLLEQFKEREGHCVVTRGHKESVYELGNWVQNIRHKKIRCSSIKIQKLDALGFIWDPHKVAWEEGFRKLLDFYKKEGNCLVRRGSKVDGFGLDLWVVHQRQKKGSLSMEQIKRLDALGFIWDPIAAQWEEGFSKLLKFCERMDSCKVPAKHKEDGYNLGAWVSVQRLAKDKLSNTRIMRLDALGFIWDPHKVAWEEGFRKLLDFYKKEGNCLVRRGSKVDGFGLDLWVVHQRQKKGSLSMEQIKRLDALGFIWDPIAAQWEEGFSKLLKFCERMDSCKVPAKHKEDGYNLGAWVQGQRRTKDKISPERKQRLDDIGFIWTAKKDIT